LVPIWVRSIARDGAFEPGARVLFMHIGGLPALFAYEPTVSKQLQELETTTAV
jgi:hypothetical protein